MTLSREEMERRVQELSAAIESHHRGAGRGSARGRGSYRAAPYHPYSARAQPRAPPGRSGLYRNRTLVLNGQSDDTTPKTSNSEDSSKPNVDDPSSSDAWISKRDKSHQLINKAVYDKRAEAPTNGQEPPNSGLKSSSFRYRKSLGILTQEQPVSSASPAPSRYQTAPAPPSVVPRVPASANLILGSAKKELCRNFCRTGSCRRGPACHFIHDPNKVSICKEYLQKGSCRNGARCNLSHDANPHRVSACIHFARGNCTNGDCRYAHVKISPSAPICAAFANLGYCEDGAACPNRHEFECPEYSSKGTCSNPKCRLPHIDRAGQLRQTTGNASDSTNASAVTLQKQPSSGDGLAQLEAALNEQEKKSHARTTSSSSASDEAKDEGKSFREQLNFVPLGVDDDLPED